MSVGVAAENAPAEFPSPAGDVAGLLIPYVKGAADWVIRELAHDELISTGIPSEGPKGAATFDVIGAMVFRAASRSSPSRRNSWLVDVGLGRLLKEM